MVAMDMGYDNNRVYAECAERDCAAIIPLRRGQKERRPSRPARKRRVAEPLPPPLIGRARVWTLEAPLRAGDARRARDRACSLAC